MTTQKLTGGQMVVDFLIREGVEKVFAIPGHGNTALLDAFVDRADEIELVPAMHEQGAAHMADGYYRASGKIAAICTSIGPGATNTLTGLATAFADSMPMLLITGAVHTYMENRGVLQEIDRPHGNNFPRMVEPVVKRWWQPSRLEQLPVALAQAFNTMHEGRRGPVLVDIPQDLQAEYGDYTPDTGARRPATRATGDPAVIAEAARLLAGAKRPVIVVGGGVIHAEAAAELMAVAEHLGAPVTHSFQGKGAFPADHDLYAWPCGDMGSIPGNGVTRTADVILAVGCRFSDRITSSYRPGVTFDIPNTKLVQIDIDGFEIGRNYPVEVGVVGDAKTSLAALRDMLADLGPALDYRNTDYFAELQDLKAQWDEHLRPMRTTDYLPMTNSRAMVEIRKALPREGILVTDSSNPANQAFNEFPIYGPKTNIVAGGFSGIGFGVPAAIGAQIGAPDTPVLAMVGDGSFLQTGTEIATAAMLGVPLVIVVLNNGGWEAIKDLQISLFGEEREIISGWKNLDGTPYFADITRFAQSLGCSAERVEDPEKLADAIERAFATPGPVIIEAMSAHELPWTEMHPTGWWDITVPAYHGEVRDDYVAQRGF
ncbi:thiamine pyrophosphate-binding protein [Rhodococcus sp. IEGM 1351]|uniref:thiamine pyrophosphate-binding protein n=1 Tax=Rhodococcus sp. IEGM 1351 TaxID=3047089 RepID=UPI0024B7D0F9|nr:thiamine pyrophosphate-binding protein [Rhodococcus sp. IEGM 1351]MDI9937930.1 thiamine pyrophosphate-binding protein [Rhodococcus sp. IEGM 1351]